MTVRKLSGLKTIVTLSLLFNVFLISYIVYKQSSYFKKPFDQDHIKYAYQRNDLYKMFPVNKDDIVFLGDSHMQHFALPEFFIGSTLKNRGIHGDVTKGVFLRLDDVIKGKPKKIFLEVGTNDIYKGIKLDSSMLYVERIMARVKQITPQTKLYVISVFPSITVNPIDIITYNLRLKEACIKQNITFLDLYSIYEKDGGLKTIYDSGDKLHLSPQGYVTLTKILTPYL